LDVLVVVVRRGDTPIGIDVIEDEEEETKAA
jgi:hypothetical protein